MVAAGAVVTPGTVVRSGEIWGGECRGAWLRSVAVSWGCTWNSELQASPVTEERACLAINCPAPPPSSLPSPPPLPPRPPAGSPAAFLRKLKPEEAAFLGESAEHYARLAAEHLAETSKPLEQVAREKGLAA